MKANSAAGYSGTPLPKKLGLPATGTAVFEVWSGLKLVWRLKNH
jgi:hypothetical protein